MTGQQFTASLFLSGDSCADVNVGAMAVSIINSSTTKTGSNQRWLR